MSMGIVCLTSCQQNTKMVFFNYFIIIYGIHCFIHNLQWVQNTAACLLTQTIKHKHITFILRPLHWIPVAHRIQLKILLFVYRPLHDQAPTYLSDLLRVPQDARVTRSPFQTRLVQNHHCMCAFSAPCLWNKLPHYIRNSSSFLFSFCFFSRQS